MNIFYLDKNMKKNAKYHVDKHVVKMITEAAQLLCTAIWVAGGIAPYRKTHTNHPCAIWARANRANWLWLKQFGIILGQEYTYRYGKKHKSHIVIEGLECPELPDGSFSPPPQCMPDEYKVENNTVLAYRQYYLGCKHHIFNWKLRHIPDWIAVYVEK